MIQVCTVHSASLDPDTGAQARALLEHAFGADFTDHSWDHALGGMHVLIRDGGLLVGHASVVLRRLVHRTRALRTGYVEAVAVHAEHRRSGHAGTLMDEVERLVRGGYELGALGASPMAVRLYTARGWLRWRGECWALGPDGPRRSPDSEGSIYVLPGSAELDITGTLTCDWRDGEVW